MDSGGRRLRIITSWNIFLKLLDKVLQLQRQAETKTEREYRTLGSNVIAMWRKNINVYFIQ